MFIYISCFVFFLIFDVIEIDGVKNIFYDFYQLFLGFEVVNGVVWGKFCLELGWFGD